MTRKLTRNTIKPVLKYCRGQQLGIYAMNVPSFDYYHFTLDTYGDDNHNSFQGGFAESLNDCYDFKDQPFDMYAIENATGKVYDLTTKQVVFTV